MRELKSTESSRHVRSLDETVQKKNAYGTLPGKLFQELFSSCGKGKRGIILKLVRNHHPANLEIHFTRRCVSHVFFFFLITFAASNRDNAEEARELTDRSERATRKEKKETLSRGKETSPSPSKDARPTAARSPHLRTGGRIEIKSGSLLGYLKGGGVSTRAPREINYVTRYSVITMNLCRTCCSSSIYSKDKQSRMSSRFLGFLEMSSACMCFMCVACVYVCSVAM